MNDPHVRQLIAQFDEAAQSGQDGGKATCATMLFEVALIVAANVGRLATAAERIADKIAPEKPPEPKRDFIGMPPQT